MRAVAAMLVHHPVLDRSGAVVTTAITNLDLHDIARSAYTFGLDRYYVVHPIEAQRELARRVRQHWVDGSGARRIPDRRPPMEQIEVVDAVVDARAAFAERCGSAPELWVTSARELPDATPHEAARSALRDDGPPVLLAFGTGWGLAPQLVGEADVRLAPITSPRSDGYNHLSVRAAAAIYFARLLG